MNIKRRKLSSLQPFTSVQHKSVADLKRDSNAFQSPVRNEHQISKGYVATPERSFSSTLSNEELSRMYSDCIKMATENKINQKNSWQLNLLDYLDDVLDNQEVEGDNTNFQAAGCALDASIKIYSCRVDSVHTDTYKVLGGLTRTERDYNAIEEQEENVDSDAQLDIDHNDTTLDLSIENALKTKLKKRIYINTLEVNIEVLNAKKFDQSIRVDPLFHKTSAAFDGGGAKGLLLNHLSVADQCALIFDSSDVVDSLTLPETSDSFFSVNDLIRILEEGGDIHGIENLELCGTFSRFTFEGVQSKDEDESIEFEGGVDLPDNIDSSEDFTFPIAEEQDPIKIDDEEEKEDNESKIQPDFQFFDPSSAKKLLGDHWQFTTAPKRGNSNNESSKKRTATKKKKEILIDFFADPPPASRFALPSARQSLILPDSAFGRQASKLITLPEEPVYKVDFLEQLFTKSNLKIGINCEHSSDTPPSDEEGEGERRYKEDNGPFEYHIEEDMPFNERPQKRKIECENSEGQEEIVDDLAPSLLSDTETDRVHVPELGKRRIMLDFKHNNSNNYNNIGNNDNNNFYNNDTMVEKPIMVIPFSINYAKTNNKTNVKVLKSLLWDELCQSNNDGDVLSTNNNYNNNQKEFVGEKHFKAVMERVANNNTNNKEVGDMSIALCFICALHLCNENGLSLKQENIDELIIVGK